MEKYYSRTHEWVQVDGDLAIVGISSYAIQELGNDVTYVQLPREGKDVIVDDPIAALENGASSQEVYTPVSGTVVEINSNLSNDPRLLARSPEDCGWICKLDNLDLSDLEDLMSEEDYKDYIESI